VPRLGLGRRAPAPEAFDLFPRHVRRQQGVDLLVVATVDYVGSVLKHRWAMSGVKHEDMLADSKAFTAWCNRVLARLDQTRRHSPG
jgi:hypothetical protein